MVFSSLVFLFLFLPVVIIINYWLPSNYRNGFLFFANLIFYAYGEPVYVILMLVSVLGNYLFARILDPEQIKQSDKIRKAVLFLSIVFNVGMLVYFKYTVLILDTLRLIPFLGNLPHVNIVLPIGISFYTFQAMSYVIDVYRRDCRCTRNFIDFGAYISLFPQLIAGPIVRYADVASQIRNRRSTFDMFSAGIKLFVVGLAKKVLLANQFGIIWETVYSDLSVYGTGGAWIGAIAYALQIYFDFGGYSDMARGLGKMLGFEFCINFSYPYISRTITEFWRRWHISLSTWFRDYVYIPLGGNRVSLLRNALNIFIVWALTGLWHGAGWNFLAWGIYYGIILLCEKFVYGKALKKLPAVFGHIYTLFIVVVGWIFFVCPDFGSAFNYLKVMFVPQGGNVSTLIPWWFTFVVGFVSCTPLCTALLGTVKLKVKGVRVLETLICIVGFILCVASLVTETYNPFIYFQF